MVSVQNISIVNCSFQNNTNSLRWSKSTTNEYGGAMYIYNSILNLTGNTFQNNFADRAGGALYAYKNNTLILSENTFQNNSATHGGGAVYVYTKNTLTFVSQKIHFRTTLLTMEVILRHTQTIPSLSQRTHFRTTLLPMVEVLFMHIT